jgi:hypothetical protein
MFLGENFVASQMPVSESNFDPLPAGWYQAKIAGAEVKATKAGTGQYIAVRYDIVGPTHQGRVVFGNINIRNPNPQAETIGRQQLGELMRAIGLESLQDSDQLVGGNCSIKLTVKDDPQYGPSNELKGFKSMSGSAAPAPVNGAPASQPAAASTPPWMRK